MTRTKSNQLSRRSMLALTGAAIAEAALPAGAAEPFFTGPSLNTLARARGFGFGACLGTDGGPQAYKMEGTRATAFENPRMRALVKAECGILVPENEMKWSVLRPNDHQFRFARADRLAKWTKANHLALRGHTLFWNNAASMQPWVRNYDPGPHPAQRVTNLIVNHIRTVCARYGKQVFSFDGVNEAIDPASGSLRDTVYSRALGPELIDLVFHTAREAAPQAQLVYNDYMSWTKGEEAHRTGVLKLLERLRKANVPVDALGIQAHIGTRLSGPSGFPEIDEKGWRHFLDAATGMGYDLVITEFDVQDRLLSGTVAERDAATAARAKAYLDLMLSYPQLRFVMAWNISDRYCWLRNADPRPDGTPKRPCPYDDALRPKPMREAIAAAFRAAPQRKLLPGLIA